LLSVIQEELQRELAILGKTDPAAYYLGYTLTDSDHAEVVGSNGALLNSQQSHNRWLESTVRVGSFDLDNTHSTGTGGQAQQGSYGESVPIDDDAGVLRRAMWRETDAQYRAAAEAFVKVSTSKDVAVQTAEQRAPDFSQEKPNVFYGPHASFTLDRKPWEERTRTYTKFFHQSADILNSIVTFTAQADNQYQVTSEGTKLQFGQVRYRLELYIQGKASDGMDINRYYNFDWTDPAAAPDDKAVLAQCAVLQKELEGLVKAPLVEPFAGPAMLTGRATAVFFHEVFGHRDEGFRQKDINEGQTFARKVGQPILPTFLSIVDDPTAPKLGSNVLLGYYPYDDEGVAAQKVTLVDHGVLKNFEMSRQPILGFLQSNGHGRRQVGLAPVSRQGNLIVQSSHQVSNAELRKMLIDETKKQGKPFGLLIDDIAGGFTLTGRSQPQAFQVEPLVVYEVFPDGRPDMLVRGVDIVGTPLVSLTKIIATGDTMETFNGFCGAESGSVPVSASAPAILMTEMEVQKKESSTDRPPILPPPAHDSVTVSRQ
jgi:TldD protein